MKEIKEKLKKRTPLVPLFCLCVFCVFHEAAEAAPPLGQEEQRRLANTLSLNLARLPADAGADEKEALYLRIVEECPATEDAQEAHWALSNLYLDGFAEPREEDAKNILKRFLARYPSSRWAVHVRSRLDWLNGAGP
jgi:hypothetical protein